MHEPSRQYSLTSDDARLLAWLGAVARRADALAAGGRGDPVSDRRIWLRAEFEFFERLERSRPRSPAWAA